MEDREHHFIGICHYDRQHTSEDESPEIVGEWELDPIECRTIERWFHHRYICNDLPIPNALLKFYNIVDETVGSQWSDQGFADGRAGTLTLGVPERYTPAYRFGLNAGVAARAALGERNS